MKLGTHGSPRCTAKSSRSGQPCKRWAIVGGTVCPTHGGSAKQVKQTAAERLAVMVDPALNTLQDLLASTRDDVRLGAVKDILDRNGFKPADKVDLNARVSYGSLSDAELEDRIADLQGAARAATRASRGTSAQGVSD